MKLFDWILGRKSAELTYDQVAGMIDGSGSAVVAGYAVTEKSALQVSTVLACVRAIADGCATPPLHVYRELPDGRRELATDIPEYRLLARRPNQWQTSFEWRRQMTMHAALCGAGLSIKVRNPRGKVVELIPVEPGKWDIERTSRYELIYRCYDEFGLIGRFSAEDVFVLNNVQWDWVKHINAVSLARSAVGLAIATERSQERFHNNALQTPGVYSVNDPLTQEQQERLSNWIKTKAGKFGNGDPLILDRGAKWQTTVSSSVDAQHLETRAHQVAEICRAYGVFPIIVGHNDKASTFASAEAFFAGHRVHTLTPWQTAWTQRLDEMMLDGSGPLFVGFDNRYLTAGSLKDRAQWARTMAEMGIYTRNEIRDEEGRAPLPGLDEPLTPLNMTRQAGQGSNNDPQDPPPNA